MYSLNVVLGLLDELLELKKYVKHESEASQALDLLKSYVALTLTHLLL